jgi:hypothetical protein
MTIPSLKRIKVASEQALNDWLAAQPEGPQSVMLVTFNKAAPARSVSRDQVARAVQDHGWVAGRRYTLNKTLVGHVISRPQANTP